MVELNFIVFVYLWNFTHPNCCLKVEKMADDGETKKEVETKRTVHTYPLIRVSNNAGIVNK